MRASVKTKTKPKPRLKPPNIADTPARRFPTEAAAHDEGHCICGHRYEDHGDAGCLCWTDKGTDFCPCTRDRGSVFQSVIISRSSGAVDRTSKSYNGPTHRQIAKRGMGS